MNQQQYKESLAALLKIGIFDHSMTSFSRVKKKVLKDHHH
jgi:hypothetical protein